MHPVHIPVHPLSYSFNVYQVLAVNSLYVLFSYLVFTIHCHVHVHVACACTSDSLIIQLLACKILLALCSHLCMCVITITLLSMHPVHKPPRDATGSLVMTKISP